MTARTRVLAREAVRGAARVKDRLAPPAPGIAVLLYHRVGSTTPSVVDVPTHRFARQVAEIAPRAVSLDAALEALAGASDPGGAPPVVVTFDDGTADIVDIALPILVEHRVPALVYVASGFVEDRVDFPEQGRPASWAALADALSTGLVAVGSHTHRHVLLDRADPATVDDELDRSIGTIRDRLGHDPVHFAYPKALPGSPAADAAVRARFRSAALAGTRTNAIGGTDPWALARIPVQAGDDESVFGRKLAGGLSFEDDLRRTVNRYRYRGAVT